MNQRVLYKEARDVNDLQFWMDGLIGAFVESSDAAVESIEAFQIVKLLAGDYWAVIVVVNTQHIG